MSPEEFAVIEAMATERAREIARTEISRALRGIANDILQAFTGGRFDDQPEADVVISYLDEVFRSTGERI